MHTQTLKVTLLQRSLFLFILLSTLISFSSYAQKGSLKGTIKDAKTGESIIGANILIEGISLGASTDIEGNYTIPNIPEGTYTLVITFISYKTKKMEGVKIESGKATLLNTEIEEDIQSLGEVVIVGERETNTDMSLVNEIKVAQQVVSGISAEQISKGQDRDAAQVLRRVPGLTIIDDRFVIIRGLNERYNAVMLNGVYAPSTETDSRAFSFDLIPSSLLDRMLIYKSGSPDNPGDFGGAVVKVYTKNVVSDNYFHVSVGASYRPGSTFENFTIQQRGGIYALGFNNGSQEITSDFARSIRNAENNFQFDEILAKTRSVGSNDWKLSNTTTLPDARFRIELGRKIKLGSLKLNSISALNYSNTNQFFSVVRKRYSNYDATGRPEIININYDDRTYTNNIRFGLLQNFALFISPKHKIEWKNMYNSIGNEETTLRTGYYFLNSVDEIAYSLRYQNRGIYSGQLLGFHDLTDKVKLTWATGLSHFQRTEPNWKRTTYNRKIGSGNPFQLQDVGNADKYNSRFGSSLSEITASNTAELSYTFKNEKSEQGVKLAGGYYLESKSREFNAAVVTYTKSPRQGSFIPTTTLQSPIENAYQNMGLDSGWVLSDRTSDTDKYTASNLLLAGYTYAVIPVGKFEFTTGLRIENNTQKLDAVDGPLKIAVDNPITRLLPSLNATYNVTDKFLARLAYSRTLNRPEFRELAPFNFYDYNLEAFIVGNDKLKICDIQNYDLRFEYYPSAGQTISLGTFYKDFTNPIEANIQVGSNRSTFSYTNVNKAYSYGLEAEVRLALAYYTQNNLLKDFSLVANGSLIRSEIDLGDVAGVAQDRKRPLQGQSPYVYNLGVYYENEQSRLKANVMYNVYGERILFVGEGLESRTIYEMPRHLVDINIGKSFGEKHEVRLGVVDLLNAPYELREDGNSNEKLGESGIDNVVIKFNNRQYITLNYTFKF